MKFKSGSSRFVILWGDFAFKFPKISAFRRGIKQNKNEWKYKNSSRYLAHLYYSVPFGLCNIMERLEPLDVYFTSIEECWDFITKHFKDKVSDEELDFLLSDGQFENFGRRVNEIIKLDWGM